MSIKNNEGVKMTAKNKAKLVLQEYLAKFNLAEHCSDFADLKRTEPGKINEQVVKIMERLAKPLVIK